MKNTWVYLFGILWGVSVFCTGPAQAASTGKYYAVPSWDQQLKCNTTKACSRFVVLSDWGKAAVLDKETGLVWEQSPSTTTLAWIDAHVHCIQLTVDNRNGWRLPTVQELASLIDPTNSSPALPSGHPFTNIQLAVVYWSANTVASDATSAWFSNFANGKMDYDAKSAFNLAWCVRGGQGVDPQ